MDFALALILYLVILILFLAATWHMGMRLFSAITVSLLVAAIFLMVFVPPSDLDRYTNDLIDGQECHERDNIAVGIMCAIYIITLLLVLWYVLCKAQQDIC